jgi:hypothetical protein
VKEEQAENMSLETAAKTVTDVASQTLKVADAAVKKAWSIMEAAAEKKSPSEYLGSKAIKSIQGEG